MVWFDVGKGLELLLNHPLSTLLYLIDRNGSRAVPIGMRSQQAITYPLGGQAAFARLVKTHLVCARRSDLHEVLFQSTPAGGLHQQPAGLHIHRLTTGVLPLPALQKELGRERGTPDGAGPGCLAPYSIRMTGIEKHHHLVGHLAHAAGLLRDFLVGDGLTVVGQQAFFAALHGGVVPTSAVTRKVDKGSSTRGHGGRQILQGSHDSRFSGLGIA